MTNDKCINGCVFFYRALFLMFLEMFKNSKNIRVFNNLISGTFLYVNHGMIIPCIETWKTRDDRLIGRFTVIF